MPRRAAWFDLDDPACEDPDVAILGLPDDGSASRHRGAALAPARLRELSRTSDAVTRRGTIVEGILLRDYGDVPPSSDRTAAIARFQDLPPRAFRIVLGGDNAVSVPSIETFAPGEDVGVIWVDAHPDLFDTYDGSPDSHACALRRAIERRGVDPAAVTLLGVRSWSVEEVRYAEAAGIEPISAAEWHRSSTSSLAERIAGRMEGRAAIYLAIDIDAFDASSAPGTGYPLPGGLTPERFFRFLERLFDRVPIRAVDLTEIAPPLDVNDMTSFLGVQIVLEVLGLLAWRG